MNGNLGNPLTYLESDMCIRYYGHGKKYTLVLMLVSNLISSSRKPNLANTGVIMLLSMGAPIGQWECTQNFKVLMAVTLLEWKPIAFINFSERCEILKILRSIELKSPVSTPPNVPDFVYFLLASFYPLLPTFKCSYKCELTA